MNQSQLQIRRLAAGIAFVLVAVVSCGGGPSGQHTPVKFRAETMGTWATITIVTSDSAAVSEPARDAFFALHRVDSLMSNWSQDSEVAHVNHRAFKNPVNVGLELAAVLKTAKQITEQSNGAFDISIEPLVRLWGFLDGAPRVPSAEEIAEARKRVGRTKVRFNAGNGSVSFIFDGVGIDLGGIAKGFGADQAAGVLRRTGVANALIDLSGNMVAMGDAAGHPGWAVGIRDPDGKAPWLARLVLHNEAVATSGNYEQFVDEGGKRYGHILDPRTGWPAEGLSSVTVVCADAMVADAWATAFFVLGPQEARRIAAEREDLSVILIEPAADDAGATIWVEETLRSRFELLEEFKQSHAIRYF
jgi:thiamine biosynthesis lipoprotein